MLRRTGSIGLPLSLLAQVALLLTTPTVVASDFADLQGAIVGHEVFVALEDHDGVSVVVMLTEPPAMHSGNASPEAVRGDIAAIQEEVLATLAPSEFLLSTRYENVPAFAGRLFRRGVDKLRANPRVVRVDLDPGGGGTRLNTNEEEETK